MQKHGSGSERRTKMSKSKKKDKKKVRAEPKNSAAWILSVDAYNVLSCTG